MNKHRLPTITELCSIAKYFDKEPLNGLFWSSDTYSGEKGWAFDFNIMQDCTVSKNDKLNVLLVKEKEVGLDIKVLNTKHSQNYLNSLDNLDNLI